MLLTSRRLERQDLPATEDSRGSIDIPDRYELKYVIAESQAEAIRRAIAPFCVCDPHASNDADHAYPIQSLYLDTPTYALFRMSQERRACRWKARIRRYRGSPSIFLEIKSKDHDVVKKERACIPADGWAERLHRPTPADCSPGERVFRERMATSQLAPHLMVRYQREAWLSAVDSYARVTFDRRIVCQSWTDWSFADDERGFVALDDPRSMGGVRCGVLLELKCLRAVPRWLSALTRTLGLRKARYSKYCKGIDRLAGRGEVLDWLDPR